MVRVIFFLILMLSFPMNLLAVDPIIGDWKLNVSKSKFPSNYPTPKEQTETYRELSDGYIELTYKNIEQDGSSVQLVETYPIQGGMAKIKGKDAPVSFIQTRVSENEWYVTVLLDGKQMGIRHKKIANDGKTLTQNVRGFDNKGQFIELLLILEKQ